MSNDKENQQMILEKAVKHDRFGIARGGVNQKTNSPPPPPPPKGQQGNTSSK